MEANQNDVHQRRQEGNTDYDRQQTQSHKQTNAHQYKH